MRWFLGWAFLSAILFMCCGVSFAETSGLGLTEVGVASVGGGDYAGDYGGEKVINGCLNNCCTGNWLDNTTVWLGADTYKSLGERITNINGGTGALTGSFGGVAGFNTGFGLGESRIRGQFGASYGVYDPMGRLGIVPQADEAEEQSFVTLGVYKRGDLTCDCDPWSWGIVYDNFHGNQWGVNANTIDLGQVRYIVGYAVNPRTEIGMWGTFGVYNDEAAVTVAGAPGVLTTVRAANQANLYLRKDSIYGASLMFYAGAMDGADICDWQFGMNGLSPVSDNLSLYANFNYVIPSASQGPIGSGQEQWNFGVGLVYYFGGKAVSPSVTGHRGLPLLPVATNGTFLVTD